MIKHFRHAIEETLPWLSSIGADPTGGMTRLLYSPEWLETQQQFKKRMAESGLETRFDDVGNLYGRLCGTQFPEQVILSGSHIDTVVNGGNLDGQFGALAAWLALDWLKATYGAPLAARTDIRAFVELHIEQGCVLESNGQSIGVVNAIVGQRRYTVTLNGESNHAGTTPMGYRRDTVHAFSRICSQSIEKAKQHGDPLVLTFGKVEPQPNTVNVVPGKTIFTIDCRHTDAAVLREFTEQLENDMRAICDEMDISIDIDLWMDEAPVPMNAELVAALTRLCETEQLNYRIMHSGAGHDAQIFAPRVPTCMIFVPSINGISHNPAERTNINDLAEGVKTLALMLHQLAWQK
ncbi:hydantoinase/carbamoylase family amidase [Salmonella enterica]|nr:hydantoinase/carbamoylase family amidase [Salmonella enterica]